MEVILSLANARWCSIRAGDRRRARRARWSNNPPWSTAYLGGTAMAAPDTPADDRGADRVAQSGRCHYGDLIGVSDVSLEVPEGSVVALLGSNGAGKTTTLNAIAGLIAPACGADLGSRASRLRACARYAIVRHGGAVAGGLAVVCQQSVEQ